MTSTTRHLSVIAVMTTALSALAHLPGLWIGPSLDAAVFMVVGWRLTQGEIPYVDVWDHKPPVIYLVDAFATWFQPGAAWPVVWALSVLAVAAIGVMVAASIIRWAGPVLAGAAACLVAGLGGQYVLTLGGGLTEPFATAFAAAAFAIALTAERLRAWVVVGLLLGLALVTSFQLAPAIVAVAAVATVRRGGDWTNLVALFGGLAIVGAALGAALWMSGAVGAAWDAMITYSTAYRAASGDDPRRWAVVPWTVLALLPLIAPALIGAARLRHHPAAAVAGRASMVWIVVVLIAIAAQNRFFAHYAIAVLPPLAILAAVGIRDLSRQRVGRRTWVLPAALLLLCAIVAAPAAFVGARQEAAQWDAANRRSAAVASVIRESSEPTDTIWVWGNAPQLYLEAERAPAAGYPYLLPLVTTGYTSEADVARLLAALEAEAPMLIVDAGSPGPGEPGFVPLLIDRPVVGDGERASDLNPLRAFVAERYELVLTEAGWPVYRLRDATDEG